MNMPASSPHSGLALGLLVASILFGGGTFWTLSLLAVSHRDTPAWAIVWMRRTVFVLLLFQFVHLCEHIAQLVGWSLNSSKAPPMTPWAEFLAHSLALRQPTSGMELMHLGGNSLFLLGIAGYSQLIRSSGGASSNHLRWGMRIQMLHVIEHVFLTGSLIGTGRVVGVSTLFGHLSSGSAAWGYRVWWHFAVNGLATVLVLWRPLAAWLRSGGVNVLSQPARIAASTP